MDFFGIGQVEPLSEWWHRRPASRKPGDPEGFAELDCEPGDLPTGLIVGTATITRCTRNNGHYEWHLSDVKRIDRPRKPKRMPQPVWFKPFLSVGVPRPLS